MNMNIYRTPDCREKERPECRTYAQCYATSIMPMSKREESTHLLRHISSNLKYLKNVTATEQTTFFIYCKRINVFDQQNNEENC